MTLSPILEVRNLSHIYSAGTPFEHVALNGVSFSVERGVTESKFFSGKEMDFYSYINVLRMETSDGHVRKVK